jgi:hypothetical protein
MSSEDDHDLREEARHQPSIFDSIAPDFYSPPPLTHHVDYHSKTERRKQELEVLRTKQLAKPKGKLLVHDYLAYCRIGIILTRRLSSLYFIYFQPLDSKLLNRRKIH